jgi:hypothetical protein
MQILSIDFKTGQREVLTSGEGIKLFPQWLGKGRLGYLGRSFAGGSGVVDGTRDGTIRFTSGSSGASGAFDSPRWSADGKRMVFHRATEFNPVPVQEWFSPDSRFGLVRVGLMFTSYSPAGDRVAGHDNQSNDPASDKSVIVMNADGSQRKK